MMKGEVEMQMQMRLLIALASGLFLSSTVFGEVQTSFKVGKHGVNSCEILVPQLGISKTRVLSTLKSKGYRPIVDVDSFEERVSATPGTRKTEQVLIEVVHRDARVRGLLYLDARMVIGPAVAQTKLELKVVGEKQQAPLYESNGYELHLLSDHSDLFDADDLPACVTK